MYVVTFEGTAEMKQNVNFRFRTVRSYYSSTVFPFGNEDDHSLDFCHDNFTSSICKVMRKRFLQMDYHIVVTHHANCPGCATRSLILNRLLKFREQRLF